MNYFFSANEVWSMNIVKNNIKIEKFLNIHIEKCL